MKLVRWYPSTGLNRFESEMEGMFNGFFPSVFRGPGEEISWMPKVNVKELDDRFELTAEIPGMEKEELSIEVQENLMTIRGEKKTEEKAENEKMHICEVSYGKFERSFRLPENTRLEDVDAEYKNGVLRVSIPKTEPAKPKEIKVKVK
ncbi:MAG: Hsp20/alpha crystallin family protein [Candidatus Krumholzibacteriota bacterium]|nr:Hsp20/alpha crystallin family protein [Candidatus Krumholzibacteriota bacterium]